MRKNVTRNTDIVRNRESVGAESDGGETIVKNVILIRDANTERVKNHGNVIAKKVGEECFAIKVIIITKFFFFFLK